MVEHRNGGAPGRGGFRARQSIEDSPHGKARVARAVAEAKHGDERAVRFLYALYANNVYGYIRSMVHDDHEAEDLTQQVFVKMITAIGRYDDRGVPFFSWLLRLARNVAIDHLRARRPVPSDLVLEFDARKTTSANGDQAELVREALDRLSPDQLQVILLRHVAGLSPGEIAARMGRSESSVHGLHHRARRALQHELRRVGATPSTMTMPRPAVGLAA